MGDPLERAILQIYPEAARILDVQSFRPGYLPYPARLTLQATTGDIVTCVLKVSGDADKLDYEARILRALDELRLPVPQCLRDLSLSPIYWEWGNNADTKGLVYPPDTCAKPLHLTHSIFATPDMPEALAFILISEMPGQPLPWFRLTDLTTADRTCRLVHSAIDRLYALTPEVAAHPIATLIPSRTLEAEVQTIRVGRSVWLDVPQFSDALRLVEDTLPRYSYPLVFSNGDYNPLNFLVSNDALVGWIDFENARFEDPYIGFARFLLWANDSDGWGAGAKTGLVERFLYRHQVPPSAFLVRLVLRGLSHVQDTSPTDPPAHMLEVITDAVGWLRQALDA